MQAADRCAPRAHVGPLELRRHAGGYARQQCASCLAGTGPKLDLTQIEPSRRRALLPWIGRRHERRPTKQVRDRRTFYRTKFWRGPGGQRERVLVAANWECQWPGCNAEAVEGDHLEYREDMTTVPDHRIRAVCWEHNQRARQRGLGRRGGKMA